MVPLSFKTDSARCDSVILIDRRALQNRFAAIQPLDLDSLDLRAVAQAEVEDIGRLRAVGIAGDQCLSGDTAGEVNVNPGANRRLGGGRLA